MFGLVSDCQQTVLTGTAKRARWWSWTSLSFRLRSLIWSLNRNKTKKSDYRWSHWKRVGNAAFLSRCWILHMLLNRANKSQSAFYYYQPGLSKICRTVIKAASHSRLCRHSEYHHHVWRWFAEFAVFTLVSDCQETWLAVTATREVSNIESSYEQNKDKALCLMANCHSG